MRQIKYKIGWACLIYIVFAGLFTACKDDDNLGTADRLFRPIINDYTYGGTWIKLEWDKYEGADHFDLDLSLDSFETFVQQVETDTTWYKFENLAYDTEYYVRIKSVGTNIESGYFVNDVIKTSDIATNLDPITSDDVIDTQVRVSWEEDVYDSLTVFRNDTLVKSAVLTGQDNESKKVIISGLTENTSYVVKAYYNGDYMGKKSFKTLTAQVFSGAVEDLRDLDEDVAYSYLTQDYLDGLEDGTTVVLAGGVYYEFTGLKLSKNISFVTGYSLNGKAVIQVSGACNVLADNAINKISFKSINFIDHPDKPRTDANYGGQYILNISNSGVNVDTVSISGCGIYYKRGIVRIQSSGTVNTILIDDCVADSIGGYGVVNPSTNNVMVKNVFITNSTFSHCEKFVVIAKTATLETFNFDHVTTCFVPNSTNYLFDLNGQTPAEISITNSLFGTGWSVDSINGIRYKSVTSLKLDKNYRTSDCNWIIGTSGSPAAPIDIDQLSSDIYAIFTDPDNNDYTLLDKDLDGSVGDPRWW